MQTFVTSTCFRECARTLDRARLGKQRVECIQILNALLGNSKGWINHPATRMWAGFEPALCMYGICMCDEWIRRGYKDTCRDKLVATLNTIYPDKTLPINMPFWWGGKIHSSHRSSLLARDPKWYSQFNWDEIPTRKDAVYWPVELISKKG